MWPTVASATPSSTMERAEKSWSATSTVSGVGHELALRGAADDVVAGQSHEGVGDVGGLDTQLLGDLRRFERLVQRAAPLQTYARTAS